jgi:outer membrane receptor for ferrienterochelin and colicins
MRPLALVLALGTLLLTAADALADVASEARFFDGAGRRAYDAGHYEQALESFQFVQEIAPSQRMLYNIAVCADLAGRGDMAFALYQEYLGTDDAEPARRADAEHRAERLKGRLALVSVDTEPAGALVYVDRKELGQFGTSPLTLAVPEGEHRILVERLGFARAEVPVSAKTGSVVRVTPKLVPTFGVLAVTVLPGSATLGFAREGAPVTATPVNGGYRLQVGHYRVLASAPGYAPAEAQVTVSVDAKASVDLSLVPLPRATGTLLVSTRAVPAELFVDGRRVAVTPATLREISIGPHTLEVRAAGRRARRSIDVIGGRATYVDIELGGGKP